MFYVYCVYVHTCITCVTLEFLHYRLFSMHVLCIFSTNLTLCIRTKDLHSMVSSRKPVVVPIECPNPKPWPPAAPLLKVPEPTLQCNLRTKLVVF